MKEVAARTGTSKTHIADFETGKRDITLRRVFELASRAGGANYGRVPPEGPSVLAKIVLQVHARGATFAKRQLSLYESMPDCLPPRHT